jgi:hypothetical protein
MMLRAMVFATLASAVLGTTSSAATLPPFDFTGTWTGTARSQGRTAAMSATFTSTGPTEFTGSVTLESVGVCQVEGTYGKRIKLHATCPTGSETLVAHLNRAKETLSGSFAVHHHRQRVTYKLTKNAA